MAVLCLVQFVDVLGVTELLSAVPRMLAAVSAPASAASAVLTAYAMCFGGLLMVGARLGDRFGHRRVLLCGIGAFAAGSLCAALASSVAMLIAGRCLQGASAAASVPAALRLLIVATPHQAARRAAMSGWSAAGAAAGASGFVVGGVLTQLLGWRAMFWLNLPLALVIAVGVLRVTPASRLVRRPALQLGAGALFSTGLAGLVVGASALEPPSRPALGLAAIGAGVALLALVSWAGRRVRDPLIPAEVLRHRALRAGTAAAFLNTATTSSALAIATLELQRSQHLSPAASGLRLLPVSVGAMAGAALATPALRRWTPRGVIGLGLAAIAVADATLVALDHSGWLLAGPVGAVGLGIGVSSVAANGLGTEVGEALQAGAAGAINTAAQLGTALGVAALLLAVAATAHSPLPVRGADLGWAMAAALALTGAAAIAPLRGSGGRRRRRAAGT